MRAIITYENGETTTLLAVKTIRLDNEGDPLIGQIFQTEIEDREEDDEYGEVIHKVGARFRVHEHLDTDRYMVAWLNVAYRPVGDGIWQSVPAASMWTIWTRDEILTKARPVTK